MRRRYPFGYVPFRTTPDWARVSKLLGAVSFALGVVFWLTLIAAYVLHSVAVLAAAGVVLAGVVVACVAYIVAYLRGGLR